MTTTGFSFDPYNLQDPYPFFNQARIETPVFFYPPLNYWVVTRYADIKSILKDTEKFSSANVAEPIEPLHPSTIKILNKNLKDKAQLSSIDPPDHTRIRNYINRAFSPTRVAALSSDIRQLVIEQLESFFQQGTIDIVKHLLYELPAKVIFRLLGIPQDNIPKIKYWAKNSVTIVLGKLSVAEQIEQAHAMVDYWNYCKSLVASNQIQPEDTLVGDLLQIHNENDSDLSLNEISSLVWGLLVAGHETFTNLSANSILVLLEQRHNWVTLCKNPSLIPNAVEELLRYCPPIFSWRRRNLVDIEIAGNKIPTGSNLLLYLGSANRDKLQFIDPDVFDINRVLANQHLSFGYGVHHCLGAPLARLELRIVLEELIKQIPTLRLVENQTFDYLHNISFRGPQSILVEWDIN